jgi:putative DNA primase/helicase
MFEPISEAPDALINIIRGSGSNTGPSSRFSSVDQMLAPGQRNVQLTSLAGSLRRKGMSVEVIFETLMVVNSSSNNPLHEMEVRQIAYGMERYDPALDLSEQGLSRTFAGRVRDLVRYVTGLGWLSFKGTHWDRDPEALQVQELIKSFLDAVLEQLSATVDPSDPEHLSALKQIKHGRTKAKNKAISELAKSDPLIHEASDLWGDVPNMINYTNGTLELGSDKLRSHDPNDRIMVALGFDYDPGAECPLFDRTLADALEPEVAGFLLRIFGQALRGVGDVQNIFINNGSGANGKSVVLGTIQHTLRGYVTTLDPSSVLRKKDAGIGNDIATLLNKRLVFTSELNQGQFLDGALVKRLSGGDPLKVRLLYQEFFEFVSTATLFIMTNHPPVFDGADEALTRRLILIPWTNVIPKERRDEGLGARLKLERPGIMNRLLEGLRDFEQNGLDIPEIVVQASLRYAEDNDQVGQFLKYECVFEEGQRTSASSLHSHYRYWCGPRSVTPMSAPAFKAVIIRKTGIEQKHGNQGNYWPGIALKTSTMGL